MRQTRRWRKDKPIVGVPASSPAHFASVRPAFASASATTAPPARGLSFNTFYAGFKNHRLRGGEGLSLSHWAQQAEEDVRPAGAFLLRNRAAFTSKRAVLLSLIHISEPTRQAEISYAVFCLKK